MPIRPTRKTEKASQHLKSLAIQVNLVVHRYGLPGSTGEYVEITEHEGHRGRIHFFVLIVTQLSVEQRWQ